MPQSLYLFDRVLDRNFVFTITKEMMGDADQDELQMDDTEIYLMKGLLHQLRAMVYVIITYNVNDYEVNSGVTAIVSIDNVVQEAG